MRRRSATSRSIRNAWPEKGPASVGPALKDACAIPGATGENLGGSERGWLVVVPGGARGVARAQRVGRRGVRGGLAWRGAGGGEGDRGGGEGGIGAEAAEYLGKGSVGGWGIARFFVG